MKYNHKRSSSGGGYRLVLFLLILIFALASCRNTTLPPWAILPPVDQTKTYTVIFAMGKQESQPSDITLPSAMSVEEGSTIAEPTAPAAGEGWQFLGWSSDENIYRAFDFTVPITANASIYAFFASTTEITEDESLPEGTKASFDEATGGYEITSFGDHSEESKDIVIPSEINGIPVTGIGRQAFSGRQDINSVTIPSSVKKIGFQSFNNSSASELILSEGIESIGTSAFYNTDIVATEDNPLILPDSLTTIGMAAFGSSPNIEKVIFGENIKEIGDRAFENSGLTGELIIPATVTEIGQGAFQNCENITELVFEDGIQLEETGWNAFSNCENLKKVSLKGVSKISNSAFSACPNLTNVDATGVESIMDRAFEDCTVLSEVTNLDSVKELNSRAFQDCTKISSIEFPSSNIIIKANTGSEYGGVWAGVFEGWTADQKIIFSGLTEAPATWASAWNANSSATIVWKTE